VDFRVLGPVGVVDDEPVRLGGNQQRALLALLVLHHEEALGIDRIVDQLWGEQPPPTAVKTVQVYVSQLRKLLGRERLERDGRRYRLVASADEIDAYRFASQVAAARATDDLEDAVAGFEAADALWRGLALADIDLPWAIAEAARLEEARVAAHEERIDALLQLGRHHRLVGELEMLCQAHPLRERLVAQRMLALYRSDRQAEALATYREARARLVEELGLEPSRALRDLERQILNQDPELDVSPEASRIAPRPAGDAAERETVARVHAMLFSDIQSSTRMAQALGEEWPAVLKIHRAHMRAAIGEAGGRVNGTEGDSFFATFPDAADAARAATAAQRATRAHPWPDSPGPLAVRMGIHVGLARHTDGHLVGIEVHRAARIAAASHGGQVLVSAAGREALGAEHECEDLGAHRLKDFDDPEPLFHLRTDERHASDFPPPRVEERDGVRRRELVAGAVALSAVGGLVVALVTRGDDRVPPGPNTAVAVDPASLDVIHRVRVGDSPVAVAATAGGAWVLNGNDETLSLIDAARGEVVRTVAIPGAPSDVTVDRGALWLVTRRPDLVRIDPVSALVAERIPLSRPRGFAPAQAFPPGWVAASDGEVWATDGVWIWRVKPGTPRAIERHAAPVRGPLTIDRSVWIGSAVELDRRTMRVRRRFGLGDRAQDIASGHGAIWIADAGRRGVVRFDPRAGRATRVEAVGGVPSALAVDDRAVWVSVQSGHIVRLDPRTGAATGRVDVGGTPRGVASGEGRVWVAAA